MTPFVEAVEETGEEEKEEEARRGTGCGLGCPAPLPSPQGSHPTKGTGSLCSTVPVPTGDPVSLPSLQASGGLQGVSLAL